LELTPKYLQVNAVSKSAAREFANTKYQTGTIDFQPGDILAIVTDGLTEVFDLYDRELGDRYIESALIQQAGPKTFSDPQKPTAKPPTIKLCSSSAA
jgi:serine/threonine protein phosphatase PrpC